MATKKEPIGHNKESKLINFKKAMVRIKVSGLKSEKLGYSKKKKK